MKNQTEVTEVKQPTKQPTKPSITFNKLELTRAVKDILPLVSKKTTIPILANVLLEEDSATIAKLTATDLDRALTIPVLCAGQGEDLKVCIPAHKLATTLANLKTVDSDTVTITALENHWLRLKCGELEVKLISMAPTNFPSLPTQGQGKVDGGKIIAHNVNGEGLRTLLQEAAHAIAEEAFRYKLNGLNVELGSDGDKWRIIATDGHRLTVVEQFGIGTVDKPGSFLLPKQAVADLAKILQGESGGDITISYSDNDQSIIFTSEGGGWLYSTRKLTGQFPNWQAVMPLDFKGKGYLDSIEVDAQKLTGVVKRIVQFSDERSRALKLSLTNTNTKLTVSASSTEAGEAKETLTVASENVSPNRATPIAVGFNGLYLIDALANVVARKECVHVHFKTPQDAVLIQHADGKGMTVNEVIMPMRI